MFWFTDWLLIISSTFIVYKSYKQIIYNRYSSISNFIIVIKYIFCCFPILLNYILGIPDYTTVYWYKSFSSSMNDSKIAIIYDLYIGISMLILYIYARYYDKYKSFKKTYNEMKTNSLFSNKFVLFVAIISPIIYILVTGNFSSYLVYGLRTMRGLSEGNDSTIISMLILLSLYAFCYYLFSKKITKKSVVILVIYSVILAWLQGKRFIIALMCIVYLFYYTRSDLSKKERQTVAKVFPALFVLLVVFCYFYLVVIRPLSDTSFQSIYEMLRVDFGRDDVIKFVIQKEFFEKNHILDYPGQTILSTLFTYIPRSMWQNKPYPHYMYLTSKILGVAITDLPAGTTPSWFEMSLANFGYVGFPIGVILLPLLCRASDKLKSISAQMVVLVLLIVLLTQSIDAYLVFLFLFIIQFLLRIIFRGKKIKIKWR